MYMYFLIRVHVHVAQHAKMLYFPEKKQFCYWAVHYFNHISSDHDDLETLKNNRYVQIWLQFSQIFYLYFKKLKSMDSHFLLGYPYIENTTTLTLHIYICRWICEHHITLLYFSWSFTSSIQSLSYIWPCSHIFRFLLYPVYLSIRKPFNLFHYKIIREGRNLKKV